MSEICDGEDLWQCSQLKIRLNAFRWSTIPQKQIIIIISPGYDLIVLFLMRIKRIRKQEEFGILLCNPSGRNLVFKYWSDRGASHHQAFMLNCTTVSHTFLTLSTLWINSPSREWSRGVSLKFHLIGLCLVQIKRIRRQGDFNLV